MRIKAINSILYLLSSLFIDPPCASAFYFRLDGDRLWLQANQTPLSEILDEFFRAGVEVRLDPRVQSVVTGSVHGKDLGEALEALLEPNDYVLTWKMLGGPLGRIPKLKEIDVFKPGGEAAVQPRPWKPRAFETTRGVSGTAPEFVKDELLIGVRSGATYDRLQHLLDSIGGMIVEADASTGVYLIRFPSGTNVEALLERLLRHPLVAHAELNYVARLPEHAAADDVPATIPSVKPPAEGAIPVAVLDSGLDPRAGLSGVVSAGWDAVDPGKPLSDPEGHGTQMAFLASGLLSASGLATAGRTLPVVSIRTFDAEGKTSNFAILQALTYAAKAGAKVVNMSWGSDTDSDFMRAAMQKAARRGLILVAAAGNEPTGRAVYPAAYPQVLAVGGILADGRPWNRSNHGEFVDLSAPALAAFPIGHNGPAGRYAGTSISSVVVANALAQYLNRHPGATAASATAALTQALSPAPAGGYGAGILDAAALRRFLNP